MLFQLGVQVEIPVKGRKGHEFSGQSIDFEPIGKRSDASHAGASTQLLGELKEPGCIGPGANKRLGEWVEATDEVRAQSGIEQGALQIGGDGAIARRLRADLDGLWTLENDLQGLPLITVLAKR